MKNINNAVASKGRRGCKRMGVCKGWRRSRSTACVKRRTRTRERSASPRKGRRNRGGGLGHGGGKCFCQFNSFAPLPLHAPLLFRPALRPSDVTTSSLYVSEVAPGVGNARDSPHEPKPRQSPAATETPRRCLDLITL